MSNATGLTHVDSCPLCGAGSELHAPFEDVFEGDLVVEFWLCRRCGMVFQSTQMSDEEHAEYYAGSYRAQVQGSESPTDKDLRVQSGRARHIVGFVQKELESVVNHLDIGSSSGALLRESQVTWHGKAIGIEPGDAYRDYSQSRGAAVVSRLEDLQGQRFDLVTMAHVLEHLPNPVQYLRDLRMDWLAPGGHLLIEVPNLYGHQSLELSHTVAFSRRTLIETLEQAGFEIVRISSHSEPRSRLLSLYLLVLARATTEPASPSKVRRGSGGVRLKRKLGNIRRRRLTQFAPGLVWKPLPEMD
jgi:SAM-dependent methyltransferase